MLVKEISEKNNIPFADALWRYLGEDLLCRINEAGLMEYIWMGEEELSSDKMKLIYIENKKSMEEASDLILSEQTDIAWDGVLDLAGGAHGMRNRCLPRMRVQEHKEGFTYACE